MANSEKDQTEFVSRPYQDEILKACVRRNTIIYLPTGAGKTYIAIMALKHFAKDLQEPISEGGKRSVFITNTVALAHQQAEVISKSTPLKVAVYTGDMDVDNWSRDKWIREFEEYQVITATAQIVLNVIQQGALKITDLNVMIFDECHHADKTHPMLLLMQKFTDCPQEEQPRVIGLTGMLTKASIKPHRVGEDLRRLESTFRGTIATAKGASFNEVLIYSTCPKESEITYKTDDSNEFQTVVLQKIRSMQNMIGEWSPECDLNGNSDLHREYSKSLQDEYNKICYAFLEQVQNLGLYGGMLANRAAIVDMELMKCKAYTKAARLFTCDLIQSLTDIMGIQIRKLWRCADESKMYLDDEINKKGLKIDPKTIFKNSSSKVQKLLMCLKDFVEENTDPPMRGLIFVQKRYTARILCNVVKHYFNASPKSNVNVDFMVGQNSSVCDSVITSKINQLIGNKNNKKVLDKFKCGEINLIIATNVLEEGIDLQACNLVICYDRPKHFRSYVQTKGRARMKESHYVIMVDESEKMRVEMAKREWQQVIRELNHHLIDKAVDRKEPEQRDMERAVEQEFNEEFATSIGATVNYNSAIALVNRYCQSLSKDRFTELAPEWESENDKNGIFVSLILPIQSPLKEKIIGKSLRTLKWAQRSVAFETIKKLHEIGELSDSLLPIHKENCLELYKDVYFQAWNQFANDDPKKAGTKKHRRMHDIQTPTAFVNSMPKVNTSLYLYEIKMSPVSDTFDMNDANIKVFHGLLQSSRSYGILTRKKLPKMALMKFGQSFGQIECSVSYDPLHITLTEPEKLTKLKRFHCVLFRDILHIWKKFFVYDLEDSVVIVPTKDHRIDWNVVEQFQTWSELKHKTVGERMNVNYNETDWLYSVVCPWYRVDKSTRYVVTQVVHQTPPFPNDNFQNYAHFVENKYADTITRVVSNDQFLIGVKPVTTRLNRLRVCEVKNGRQNAKARAREPEFLIPELCHNFHYPGDLWLKGIVLPSTLHRITYILHAEHLRITINDYVGLHIVNYSPKPLIEKMTKYKSPQPAKEVSSDPSGENQEKSSKNVPVISMNNTSIESKISNLKDFERQYDTVCPNDIEYFIEIMREVNMLDDSSSLYSSQLNANVPALCDVEHDEKFPIKILDINLNLCNTRGVEQHELLAAITTISSNDVFHMESFEVLGDALLKFAVSFYLLQNHEKWQEGSLTTMKGKIVGNRNLCYSAIRQNLPGMIKIHEFKPKEDWQPPMLRVDSGIKECMNKHSIKPEVLDDLDDVLSCELEHGMIAGYVFSGFMTMCGLDDMGEMFCMDEGIMGGEGSSMQHFPGKQRVPDKTCADCVEAIIGTCVKSIGIEGTFKVLEMFEILPRNDDEDITKILGTNFHSPRVHTDIPDEDIDEFLMNHKELEKNIGYTFTDRAYLLEALTHPSFITNRITGCFQQLEFLGDAVLDFLITAHIFERCPHMDPGQLTDLRSALVNNVTLACLCARYNIHTHILYRSSGLATAISGFLDIQTKYDHEVGDHVVQLMEEEDMGEYVDVPKVLGDVFEAIIGAIFLDSGNNLKATWKVIYRLMKKEIDKFIQNVPKQVIRQLYEFPYAKPKFDDKVMVGVDGTVKIAVRFTCKEERLTVFGRGKNKKNAKRAAAKVALNKLKH